MYKKTKRAFQLLGRPSHHVSVKVALLNEAQDKVLMTVMPGNRYGLPGGHIDKGEYPQVALSREIHEEIGLKEGEYTNLTQHSFFRSGGRIILLYTATLNEAAPITPDADEILDTVWASYEDIAADRIHSRTYKEQLKAILKG